MKLYDNKYPISDNAEYVVDYIYDNPSRPKLLLSAGKT